MVTAAGRIKKLLSQLLFLLDFYITCSSSFVCVCVCVYLCVYLCVSWSHVLKNHIVREQCNLNQLKPLQLSRS